MPTLKPHPSSLAAPPPSVSAWLVSRAAAGCAELRVATFEGVSRVLPSAPPCEGAAGADALLPPAWCPSTPFPPFFDGCGTGGQKVWLCALERGVTQAALADASAALALAALPPSLSRPAGRRVFDGECLAASRLHPSLWEARSRLAAFASAHLSPPDAHPTRPVSGWADGSPPPGGWVSLGGWLRGRTSPDGRAALLRSLESAPDDAAAAFFALALPLFWATPQARCVPASFCECADASAALIPAAPPPLRRHIVARWRAALRLRSAGGVKGFVAAAASAAAAAAAAAAEAGDDAASAQPGRAVFRGTLHAPPPAAGDGDVFVFDFRVESSVDGGTWEPPQPLGVRFSRSAFRPASAFAHLAAGDVVEAEAIVLGGAGCSEADAARAQGVRCAQRAARPGAGSHDGSADGSATHFGAEARRRAAAARDEMVAAAPSAAAAAPTLPGWVAADGTNHDGAPLWAGPCSACGVLCTVPFRPRAAVGFAVGSPPLCRHCRAAQLAAQAAFAASHAAGGAAAPWPLGAAGVSGGAALAAQQVQQQQQQQLLQSQQSQAQQQQQQLQTLISVMQAQAAQAQQQVAAQAAAQASAASSQHLGSLSSPRPSLLGAGSNSGGSTGSSSMLAASVAAAAAAAQAAAASAPSSNPPLGSLRSPSPLLPSLPPSFGSPRCLGLVKFYKPAAGFGFIQALYDDGAPRDGVPDLFVHATQIVGPPPVDPETSALIAGQLVEYGEAVVYGRRQAMGVLILRPDQVAGLRGQLTPGMGGGGFGAQRSGGMQLAQLGGTQPPPPPPPPPLPPHHIAGHGGHGMGGGMGGDVGLGGGLTSHHSGNNGFAHSALAPWAGNGGYSSADWGGDYGGRAEEAGGRSAREEARAAGDEAGGAERAAFASLFLPEDGLW